MGARGFPCVLSIAAISLAGCGETESGPVRISALGHRPAIVNPNRQPLDPASAFLLEAVAQGLVRFDGAGEIEPGLAQSWIVSDDGLRYTFRIKRIELPDGSHVTARQVVERLQATISRASRSPLKPVLGSIAEIEAMTDQVLEISLRSPRPHLLQLLAQPEMAIILEGQGTGPYRVLETDEGVVRLTPRAAEEEEAQEGAGDPDLLLRGDGAPYGVARFAAGQSDLFLGGTLGELPFARITGAGTPQIVFDIPRGLFGLAFTSSGGPTADPAVRRALTMAVDRQALLETLAVPGLQPQQALLPMTADEIPAPTMPDWAASPLPMRREQASAIIAEQDEPVRLRLAMPPLPGYRLVFAHLRRDWRLIGVEVERVGPEEPADLRLVDRVAPALIASWYLRHFTCEAGPVCDPDADEALEAAREAASLAERRRQLATADQILTAITPFIALTAPVRWSLVSPRLTGFRPNAFARHPAGTLIVQE